MKLPARRVLWFIAVGCAAAAVHFLVVIALVSQGHWAPLVANVAGWLVAFLVSFAGHSMLTFRARSAPVLRAAPRFFAISMAGFAVNEGAYAVMLHLTALRYDVVLFMVLLGVASLTYVLSSRWAFLGSGPQ